MSTPAQVTEAHRQIARYIGRGTAGEYPQDAEHDAQLIADSEARAVASALSNVTCTHHNDKQRAECPVCLVAALRADVDRITIALKDAIWTYNPNCKETLVTAERQEAWIAALQEDAK